MNTSMLQAFDEYMTDFERATAAAVQAWICEGCPPLWSSGVTSHVRFEVIYDELTGVRFDYDHKVWHPYAQTYRWQGWRHWKNNPTPLHPMEVIARMVDELALRREEALAEQELENEEVNRAESL